MSKSIMQDHKECYVTGCSKGLHKHHIYGGANRDTSERMGFWVWLKWNVHMDLHDHRHPFETLQQDLREECQRRFEEMGGTREEFMRLIGRSYL